MIVTRYLSHEIIKSTAGVILILMLIGLSNEFVVVLSKAAAGELPAVVVLKMVAYNLPVMLGLMIPLGFFLGILLGYGRLYADAEMTALMACGLTTGRLLRTTLSVSAGLTVLTFVLYLWIIPASKAAQDTLFAQAEADIITRALVPGTFQAFNDDSTIVFAEQVDSQARRISNVFIAQAPQADNFNAKGTDTWSVTVSKRGYEMADPQKQANYLVLEDGSRYSGEPGRADFVVSTFAEFGFLIKQRPLVIESDSATKSLYELWHSDNNKDYTELQWRINLPLAVIVVSLLAVPLSQLSPRQSKYANLLPALIVIILYCNVLVLGRAWLEQGLVYKAFGLWWIHAVALTVAVLLIAWRLRYHRRMWNYLRL